MTTIFRHKSSGRFTKGVPVSAILQCRSFSTPIEKFHLYECLNGGGFFLRMVSEFMGLFKCYYMNGELYWTHKAKGGMYRVCGDTFTYVGNQTFGLVDGGEMKAYFMEDSPEQTIKGGLFCSATQFANEFEPVEEKSAPVQEPLKACEGFITVWKEGPLHNAMVSRDGINDVRIRGDNLVEVMKAADILLR